MHEHLIIFESQCPHCLRAIASICTIDASKKFLFAPFSGETAEAVLSGPQKDLRKGSGLVLVENYESTERRFWNFPQALFRAYWLVGYKWVGMFCFLPRWIGEPFSRRFGIHRHQFKLYLSNLPLPPERLLP